jgi:predicted ArsR family transcriptional regulator
MFRRGGPTDLERQARRVVRWLKAGGRTEVSREDVRRTALAQSVSATGADMVLTRLTAAGIVRRPDDDVSPGRGRPAERWQVNPALAGH